MLLAKHSTHFFNPYYPLQIDPKPILCCVPPCGSHIKGPLFLPKMSRGESVQNFRPPLTNGGSTFVFTGQISIIKDPSQLHFWAIFFSMKHSSCWKVHNFLDAGVSTKSSVFFRRSLLRYVWGGKWVTRYLAILGLATGFLKPHRCMEQLF